MATERYKLIFILIFLTINNGLNANDEHQQQHHHQLQKQSQQPLQSQQINPKLDSSDKGRALFSPRLEYNEWMPVGRGDPLKNDPTYDYSPPVLDRVRYWADGNANKKDKSDILILGVASKKQSTKKDAKYGPIRRNFYTQQPSTILMPPPLESQVNGDNSYHVAQNTWPQQSSTQQQPAPHHSVTHHADTHSSTPQQYNNPVVDNQSEGSAAFISIVRPGTAVQQTYNSPQYTSGMNYIEHPPMSSLSPYQKPSSMISQMLSSGTHGGSSSNVVKDEGKKPFLLSLLQTEAAAPFTKSPSAHYLSTADYSNNFYNPQSINSMVHPMYPTTEAPITPIAITTTLPPPSMTTDSLFSHYKQPAHPLRGPMYLIIEGHSKVKTYGRNDDLIVNKHPPRIVTISSTEDPVIRHVVNQDDTGSELKVEHLHTKIDKSITIEKKQPTNTMDSLLSLLDSSFGNLLIDEDTQTDSPQTIDYNEKSIDRESRQTRKTRSLPQRTHVRQGAVVSATFQVGDSNSNAAERYRPGTVVNEDRPLRIRHYHRN